MSFMTMSSNSFNSSLLCNNSSTPILTNGNFAFIVIFLTIFAPPLCVKLANKINLHYETFCNKNKALQKENIFSLT